MSLKSKYSFLQRVNLNSVYNMFLSLPPQQQTIAMVVTGFVILLLILLPVSLASSKISRMDKTLQTSSGQMGDIVFEIEQYDRSRQRLKAMEDSLSKGFDTALSTTLEGLASNSGIKENIESIKERPVVPSELFDESVVDVRLVKVTLPQLIDFLYSIEYDKTKLLRVKDLKVRGRFDNKQLFDSSFMVSTYKLQQEGEAKE